MRRLVVLFVAAAVIAGPAAVRAHAAPASCAVRSAVEHCETWADQGGLPIDGQNSAVAVGQTPDGSRVFTAGYTLTTPSATSSVNPYDFLVTGTDTATGGRRWTAIYDGGFGLDDQAVGLAVSKDGTKVFVTGQSEHATGNEDYLTVAFDVASGAQLWAARYDGPVSRGDVPTGVAI